MVPPYSKNEWIPVKITCAAMAASNKPVNLESTAIPVLWSSFSTCSAMRRRAMTPKDEISREQAPIRRLSTVPAHDHDRTDGGRPHAQRNGQRDNTDICIDGHGRVFRSFIH